MVSSQYEPWEIYPDSLTMQVYNKFRVLSLVSHGNIDFVLHGSMLRYLLLLLRISLTHWRCGSLLS